MADVSSDIKDWSVTASSNLPADATTVGAGLADNLQQIQATTRAAFAHKGSDIASAATTDIGAVTGAYHDITGTTTITGFGTVSAGVRKVLQFDGVLTLTYNATSLILPGNADITTAAGDQLEAMSLGSGNWVVLWYTRDASAPAVFPVSEIIQRKTADETVSTADTGGTLQDDDHLIFSIGANEEWVATYELDFGATSLVSMGYKAAVTVPTGATLNLSGAMSNSNSTDSANGFSNRTTSSGTNMINAIPSASANSLLHMSLWVLNGATPGNVTLQFAQGIPSATILTLRKGSFLVAHRVA